MGDGAGFNYLQVEDDVWAITYDDTTFADMSRVRNKSTKAIMDCYFNTAYAGHVKSLCRSADEMFQQYEEEKTKCCSTSIWKRIVASIKSLVS